MNHEFDLLIFHFITAQKKELLSFQVLDTGPPMTGPGPGGPGPGPGGPGGLSWAERVQMNPNDAEIGIRKDPKRERK